MTVNSTINRIEYAGDGASAVFAVGFYFLTQADLKVYLRDANDNETLLTSTTHYTVADAGNPAGGSVTMLTAPAVGEKLVIVRDPALTQLTDYQANDAFPAETHERALDKLTMLAQRISERIDRSVVLEETATSGQGSYDFGGNSVSNLGAPFDSNDASTKAYVDEILGLVNAAAGDEAFSFVPPSGVTGTANAIVLTASDVPSSPTDGYKIRFIPEADSTGAVTLQLKDGSDDWGVIALVDRKLAAMTGGELVNKVPAEAVYSEAELKWVFNHGGGGSGSVVVVRDAFMGDGVDTMFTMSVTPAADDEISVYIEGVYQNETEWSFTGTTLTLTEAPANGAKGEIVIHNQAGDTTVPADGSVTAAKVANGAIDAATKIADSVIPAAKLVVGAGPPDVVIEHRASQNTDGGSSSNSFTKVPLTHKAYDPLGICTLDAVNDQFSLEAGTYWFEAEHTVSSSDGCQSRLENVTQAATIGSNGLSVETRSTTETGSVTSVKTSGTVAASDDIEFQVAVEATKATYGLGKAANRAEELFGRILIWRIA